MGKTKRKNSSPLQKDCGKNRRVEEEDVVLEVDESSRDQIDGNVADIADLREFIRSENIRSNRALTEDLRKYNEERIAALESSLSFALAANETLAKRLAGLEARAQQTESDFRLCLKRPTELEQEQDRFQQRELRDWLVFSGPAIPRLSQSNRREDASRLLCGMLQQFMGFDMDMQQVTELRREERQICVRFASCGAGSDRYLLVRNRTRLRGTGLYIRERLTSTRQHLFNKLMLLKREGKVSTVFTRDGTVYVVVGQRDRPRPVRCEAALERLSRDVAELGADGRPGPLGPRDSRSADAAGGTREDGGLEPRHAPGRDQGGVTAGAAGAGSSSGCADISAGPGAGGRRAAGPAGSVCGGGAAEPNHRRRTLSSSGSGDEPTGVEGTSQPLAEHGAGGSGHMGGERSDDGGGRGQPVTAASRDSSASVAARRPLTGATSVRGRYGADIRQFCTVHSKCD